MNGKDIPEIAAIIAELETKLKLCPFCGGQAEIENTHTPSYWVQCTDCDCQISDPLIYTDYDSIEQHHISILNAFKSWNTRTKNVKPLMARLNAFK